VASRCSNLNGTGTVILSLFSVVLNASDYAAADILVSLNESISPLILFLYKSATLVRGCDELLFNSFLILNLLY
jgi:hypothetical protein